MDKIKIILSENKQILVEDMSKEELRKLVRDELEKLLGKTETKKEIAQIMKQFMKKFYRELSQNSSYVVDRIDV